METPSRAADYALARASVALGLTKKTKKQKRPYRSRDRGTSVSTQLICKVIRIRKTLISIIVMNQDGALFYFLSVSEEKKYRTCGLLGNIGVRVEMGTLGGSAVGGHFDIWSHRGHLVVMRRSRSDQSKRVCPSAQLSLILRQAR